MQEVRAKKALGQHFLTDQNVAAKIVEAFLPGEQEMVLEVGPGTGVLTQHLINQHDNFIAVDIDKESIDHLHHKYVEKKSQIIFADFLKFDFERYNKNLGIIGNFPYNISSQIFFKILKEKQIVPQVVCMIQKEVAERIASKPGTKKYGILSVLLQAFYEIEYLFTVHEHCFSPAPKVKSAVIRLRRNTVQELACSESLYFKIVKATFNQRRKTIRNSLKALFPDLSGEHALLGHRPEQLTVSQFVELTNWADDHQNTIKN